MDAGRPPPTGTVTFLFTDIEGSTRREQAGGIDLARADLGEAAFAAAWAEGRAMTLQAAVGYALEDTS